MGIFIRCAGHNGPNLRYSKNERQGGALHRPYERMIDNKKDTGKIPVSFGYQQ